MLSVPQGLTEEQFASLSVKVRAAAAHLGEDIQVHGSRVSGTGDSESDLDVAIRVPSTCFIELVLECFGNPSLGSAKARTMQHALETGKIQAGEAGLRSLRKMLEADLKMAVDISIVREGGSFDKGPYLPLRKA